MWKKKKKRRRRENKETKVFYLENFNLWRILLIIDFTS